MANSEGRKGKVAVVTGGARGFGKAFGAALAAEGATVVLLDLDEAAVRATAAEIGATGYGADVTDELRITAIFAEISAQHGGIDMLINNAGLHAGEYSRPIVEMGIAKTRRLFEVNVVAIVACTLLAHPHMKGRGGASIVNIASSAAFLGGAYGNSKLAVAGLTMTFARELAGDGIRVNAVAPGIILTDTVRAQLSDETQARIKAQQYLPTDGEEQDIVDAMLFLTSPQAKFVTGETLRVTGGYAAGV